MNTAADGMTAGGVITTPPRPSRRWLRMLAVLAGVGVAAAVALVGVGVWAERHVAGVGGPRLSSADTVEHRSTALVLGAQAFPDRPSISLAKRLDLMVTLWEAGVVDAVIVSGDGEAASNNEPAVMKGYLVSRGVPADKIVEDPAGYDTYDSCIRARDVYGAKELLVVSQEYHLPRALTICTDLGLDAVGVGDTTLRDDLPRMYEAGERREWVAGIKMAWDLWTHRDPVKTEPFDPALQDILEG